MRLDATKATQAVAHRILEWIAGEHDAILGWLHGLGAAIEDDPDGDGVWVWGVGGSRARLRWIGGDCDRDGLVELTEAFGLILGGSGWRGIYPDLHSVVRIAARKAG